MDTNELLAHCRDRLHTVDAPSLHEAIQLIEREPVNPGRFYRLAELCREQGDDALWHSAVQIALGLPHVTPEQIFHRGEVKLTLGDWSGWLDRESRLLHPAHSTWPSDDWHIRWEKRPWDGKEDISDKTILLIAEGTHSDCLQMMRYVPAVVSAAEHVILAVSAELSTFARHNFGSLATVTCRQGAQALPFHRYAWIMSLPALLGEPPVFVPLQAPQPTPRVSEGRLQVGLCWSGERMDSSDYQHALPLDMLRPLLDRTDLRWHSLQVGDTARAGDDYPSLLQPSPAFDTFADTANYVMSLDCVVSVSTAVAHLAGTLGVPTLLLLDPTADARWGLGNHTPWYPSMRILRQPALGDWTSVVDGLAIELTSHR
jgi:hypothetical protein